MKIKTYLILLYYILCYSVSTEAQKISGKLVSQATKEPLPYANVFLNNTLKGSTTDINGRFEINGVAVGNYEFLASYIGYKTYIQNIQFTGSDLELEVELTPLSIELKEVVVKEDKDWQYNYETFVKRFIGQTANSSQCVLTNPDVLDISFDPDSVLLKVKSDGFIIIENKALGYRIKYLLSDFRLYFQQNYQSHWGFTLFEEMTPKNQSQAKKWQGAREIAYLGSMQHFMKTLIDQNYEAEGYSINKLKRIPNPKRKDTKTIQSAIRSLVSQGFNLESDTLKYWRQQASLLPTIDILDGNPIALDSILSKKGDEVILKFQDYLQIIYKNEKEANEYLQSVNRLGQAGYPQTSMIHLVEPFATIEKNGILKNPLSVFIEGYWSWQEKISELLPYEYEYNK